MSAVQGIAEGTRVRYSRAHYAATCARIGRVISPPWFDYVGTVREVFPSGDLRIEWIPEGQVCGEYTHGINDGRFEVVQS